MVQDSLEEYISLESPDKTLQHLIDNDSLKSNSISNMVCLSIPKNNTCKDVANMKEELQSFKNELIGEFNRLTQAFFEEINSLKSDALTTGGHIDKNSSYISSLREEKEYLREENREKTLIIKQLTEVVKTTVNPTSTLVTYNENSKDKTTQNGDNVIDKTIENNNKELFKNKKVQTKI